MLPLHAAFDTVYRGFHRRQVIDHIESLEEQIRFLSIDRDEALSQVSDLRKLLEMTRRDLEQARTRLERLEMSEVTAAGAGERVRQLMAMAEEEAAELRLRAEQEVSALRARAETEIENRRTKAEQEIQRRALDANREFAQRRDELEEMAKRSQQICDRRTAELDERAVDLERRRAEFEAEITRRTKQVNAQCAATIKLARDQAERLLARTRTECQRLETEAGAHRAEVRKDFELAMSRRRAEAQKQLAEQEERSKIRVAFMVWVACREASRRIDEANRHAVQLTTLRQGFFAQLHKMQATLTTVSEKLVNGQAGPLTEHELKLVRDHTAAGQPGQAAGGQAPNGQTAPAHQAAHAQPEHTPVVNGAPAHLR